MSSPAQSIPDSYDAVWRQYEFLSGLYHFYLELTIKVNGFFYAATAAVLGVVYTNAKNSPSIKDLLVLPFLLSIALAILFLWSTKKVKELQEWIGLIQDQISKPSGVQWNIHIEILTTATIASGVTLLVFAAVIATLFFTFTP